MTVIKHILPLILVLCTYPAFAYLPSSEQDYYRVISLNGSDIGPMVDRPIEELSVFAVYDGNLEPIPYQIDEYNKGGAVYFENWHEEIDGSLGVMDPNDKLLLLFGDTGPRKTSNMLVDGEILAEIELQTQTGQKRYAYVVAGSRLVSDAQHVRYSIEKSHVETDFYSLTFDKNNQLVWKDFKYNDYSGESPIDGLKLNFTTGVISSGATVDYDNNNFIAKTVAENVGPIRTTAQLHLTFVLLGLDFIDVSIQLHFYPNGLVYDVRLVMPETRRALLANPKLSMSVDFNNLTGAKGFADFLDNPLLVDGTMSDEELKALGTEFSENQNGLLLRSNRGFDVLTFLDWVGNETMPTALYYQDNKEHQTEMDRFPGQVPDAGYTIYDFPEKGIIAFVASIYFSDSFDGTPNEMSQLVRTSPALRVNY